ncbi:phage tail protein [Pseudomonas wadenswilerensis]
MTDQNSQFFAILTAVGEAKQANANALGVPWTFAQMGVGDANNTEPVPSRTQTRLINERRRAPLNQLTVDPKDASIIIAEQVIPPDVGGWWIREIGLYDAAGDLVAVANCAPSYKPLLTQGTGKTQVVRLNLVVTSSTNVQLKIDPAVVLATRDYVDSAIISVLPRNKIAGTYTKVRINDRGVVQEGSNPTTLAGYGITDGFAQSMRASDFDLLKKSGLYNLGYGSTLNRPTGFGGSLALHHDYTDYAFTLASNMGTDSVAFRRWVPSGFTPWCFFWHSANFDPALKANLASPVFTGTPRVPNVATGMATDQAANTKFVMDAIAGLVGSSPAALDTLNELAAALGNDPNFATTMTNALAGKLNVANANMTGVPTCSTANLGSSTFQVANTKFVQNTFDAMVATQAQVNAGTDDSAFVTSKKLRSGFVFSWGANGYLVLPAWMGGFIIQWSNGVIEAGTGTAKISLPIEFTTNLVSYSFSTATAGVMLTGQSASTSSITVNARTVNNGSLAVPAGLLSYTFMCIGK